MVWGQRPGDPAARPESVHMSGRRPGPVGGGGLCAGPAGTPPDCPPPCGPWAPRPSGHRPQQHRGRAGSQPPAWRLAPPGESPARPRRWVGAGGPAPPPVFGGGGSGKRNDRLWQGEGMSEDDALAWCSDLSRTRPCPDVNAGRAGPPASLLCPPSRGSRPAAAKLPTVPLPQSEAPTPSLELRTLQGGGVVPAMASHVPGS